MVEGGTGKSSVFRAGDAIRVVYSDGNREPRTAVGTLISFDEIFLTIESGRLTLVIGAPFIMRIERWEERGGFR